MQSELNAVGQTYRDFRVTKYLGLEELESALIELTHEPTGARVLHIANADPENLFCLSFQTLPYSSNGVAHILEHTVLCGSRKFPVKDPFFAMTRRSLNTYMNALTGQDFTCYPASSQVEKDFYNLLDVYIDAVFYPELKKTSFLQEGHRLEFTDSKKNSLQYQGVVYNEMKGAMTSIDARLNEALAKHLTPDLPYAHNSGGEPKEIPSLTYEELLEFHGDFYHPSRCLFFFYGNLPLTQHLDFLEERALKGVKKIPLLPPLPLQPRFTRPVHAVQRYPIAESESLEKKTLVAFAWLTVPVSEQREILALTLLESMLTDNDASPLVLALLKSGLCTQVDSSIDPEMSEIPLAIICKGCEEKDADALRTLMFKTLEEFASRPIAQETIEASIHQLEFQRMEIGAEGIPFGLTLFMRAALIKQHGSEPENALLIHTLFNELRSRAADPNYLPSLLRKYIIENPHFVQIVLKPDPKLEKEEAAEEKKRLSEILARLTDAEKQQISAQSKELAAYQEAVESQSLDCLPKVTLKDVPPHARDFPLIETEEGPMKVFHHSCFTNQILYADLVFNLPETAAEDLPLMALFSRLLTELGCGGRDYAANLAYQQAYVGELDASLSLHVTHADPDVCSPTFSLRGKALYRNTDKLFGLFADFTESPELDDRERIKEWLQQHATALQNRLTKNSLSYAIQTSLSGFSSASYVFDQWYGIPYYRAVMKWAKHPDEAFFQGLKRMQTQILGLKHPHLVISCDAPYFEKLKKNHFYGLAQKLPSRAYSPWTGKYSLPKIEPHARIVASPVAFTSYGMRTHSYRDAESPLLLLSTELLENLVLHAEIREKGGAYGSGANYSPSTGNFHFLSLRDPQLANTIAAFEKALEKIGSGKFDDRELEEAKLGALQALDAPVPPGNRAIVAYSWKRAGRTLALREEFRRRLLSATREEIAKTVRTSLSLEKGILVTFLGKELFEKEKSKLKVSLPVFPIT